MLAAHAPLIPELETALRRIAADRHDETVRRMAAFFVAGAAHFNELHVRLFDRILGRLIAGMEGPALVDLARSLAPIANAPPDVIRRLARDDDIAVAGPVAMQSSRLDEEDLIDIAHTKSQAHLFAMSLRPVVSEVVTDILIDRGDRDVARNLAMNRQAQFSPDGMAALIRRAAHDAVLAEKLKQRHDLSAQVLPPVPLVSPIDVRQPVVALAAPEIDALDKHAMEAPRDIGEATDPEAPRSVHGPQRDGLPDETQVLDFARSGRVSELIAALALSCDVSVEVVQWLMTSDSRDAALILCQAAGLSRSTAQAILATGSPVGERAAPGHAEPDFCRLSPMTAGRIVGFCSAWYGELRAAG